MKSFSENIFLMNRTFIIIF